MNHSELKVPLLLAGLMLCVLSSSSFAQQNQYPSTACLKTLFTDPKVQILAKKIPSDLGLPRTLESLSDKSKPSAKEKVALSYFTSEAEKCLIAGDDYLRMNLPPEAVAAITDYRSNMVDAYSQLYSGDLTYGDFGKLRSKQEAELKNQISNIQSGYKQRAEAQEAARKTAEEQRLAHEKRAQTERETAAQRQENERRRTAERIRLQSEARMQEMMLQQILTNSSKPIIEPYTPPNSTLTECSGGVNWMNCNTTR